MHPRDFDVGLDEGVDSPARGASARRRKSDLRDATSTQGRNRVPGRDPHRHVPPGETSCSISRSHATSASASWRRGAARKGQCAADGPDGARPRVAPDDARRAHRPRSRTRSTSPSARWSPTPPRARAGWQRSRPTWRRRGRRSTTSSPTASAPGEVIARIRALTKREAPRKELLDVNRKVRDVLALAEHELKTHDIVLRTELAPTLPQVAGDRVQLQQVLLNLIVNAIEAMSGVHDRPRELTIVSTRSDAGAVVVEVRDSGPGLDERGAERVFEPFYTTKAQGIGIGLSISRSIVEAHGGRLWARANQPHGAVFRFSLRSPREGGAHERRPRSRVRRGRRRVDAPVARHAAQVGRPGGPGVLLAAGIHARRAARRAGLPRARRAPAGDERPRLPGGACARRASRCRSSSSPATATFR